MAKEREVIVGTTRNDIELMRLKSHERHMAYIYGVRFAGLAVGALTIIAGAAMTFLGLDGSFNWAIEGPKSIGAKLTNASPGIVFATVGMIITFVVIREKPVNYSTGGSTDIENARISSPSLIAMPSRRSLLKRVADRVEGPTQVTILHDNEELEDD